MTIAEQRQIKLLEMESSERQLHHNQEHQEKMYILSEQFAFNLFALLKPKIFRDGNKWCVLYGEDIQSGVAGFGKTPFEATRDWNKQWHEEINQ
jgi:hypothetical protein